MVGITIASAAQAAAKPSMQHSTSPACPLLYRPAQQSHPQHSSRGAIGKLCCLQRAAIQLSAAAWPQGSHTQSCCCRRADQRTELVVARHKVCLAVDLRAGVCSGLGKAAG